jgi:hypothetical protein
LGAADKVDELRQDAVSGDVEYGADPAGRHRPGRTLLRPGFAVLVGPSLAIGGFSAPCRSQ